MVQSLAVCHISRYLAIEANTQSATTKERRDLVKYGVLVELLGVEMLGRCQSDVTMQFEFVPQTAKVLFQLRLKPLIVDASVPVANALSHRGCLWTTWSIPHFETGRFTA
ncbi:MAG TPA: hypothetical protein VKG87_09430 [Terriglobales bacterium]|nr:hypothetical protein [Terriglobales bacterium]